MAYNLGVAKTAFYALIDPVKRLLGMSPVYIPAAASPGQVGGLTAEGSVEGLMAIVQDTGYVFTTIIPIDGYIYLFLFISDYPNEVSSIFFLRIRAFVNMPTMCRLTLERSCRYFPTTPLTQLQLSLAQLSLLHLRMTTFVCFTVRKLLLMQQKSHSSLNFHLVRYCPTHWLICFNWDLG
jgi:hypothetical protein